MNLLVFQGQSAFTPFRLQQKLQQIMMDFPAVTGLCVTQQYLVKIAHPLSSPDIETLTELLLAYLQSAPKSKGFWVVPRKGTLSPWSSKALDIAHHCGLNKVERIENIRYVEIQTDHFSKDMVQLFFDKMTESAIFSQQELYDLFSTPALKPIVTIPVLEEGEAAFIKANQTLGLALSDLEIAHLTLVYNTLKRNPTDAELMMFAQVNSEHCRHKIFNANWYLDGKPAAHTLFQMIKHTYAKHPDAVCVAYRDNSAILKGPISQKFSSNPNTHEYEYTDYPQSTILKVETHNHPTAIAPFAGAATGSGGEIRDEGATGRGSQTKAGLCGFSVSHLHIPNLPQPWEVTKSNPPHLATPLSIMLEGPLGAAAFNNEFGRPNVCGYFRSFEYGHRGYHKPIMLAGGIGSVFEAHTEKKSLPAGTLLIVLGGPGMAIGLGGGAASSKETKDSEQQLDFASVQRANPEMQRRAQEVINACTQLQDANPILSIHDVGAGGLSNALPELVEGSEKGAVFQLRNILSDEPSMSPLEIWCNESQERYVLAILPESLALFDALAERERCPYSVVGEVTDDRFLKVEDAELNQLTVDLPMAALFQDMPALSCESEHLTLENPVLQVDSIDLSEAIVRVLQFPAVASKSFLITIGDRSVGGLIARDQCVGPWQVPVSDVAVTCADFKGYQGEALCLGERAPIALLHPAASARMAVGEAITNLAAASIEDLSQVVLSANWMASASSPGEGAALYEAVQAIGLELCPALKISIPVGKDSLSMQSSWQEEGIQKVVTSPVSLVITATAPVQDVRLTLTPELKTDEGDTELLLIDLGLNSGALGASVLAQVYQHLGQRPADVDDPALLRNFFMAIQALNQAGFILAYHDRSDGGLLALIAEMSFAGHVGVNLDLTHLKGHLLEILFNEELGAVIQVKTADLLQVQTILIAHQLSEYVNWIGSLNTQDTLNIDHQGECVYTEKREILQKIWNQTSYELQRLRDNPKTAEAEFHASKKLVAKLTFELIHPAPYVHTHKPRVAILREQGINGHVEMAAAFERAGFQSVDVHMSDLLAAKTRLQDFQGLAVCGGFSYGDVLGAGRGFAQVILKHAILRDQFAAFFENTQTFTLGVCNGCQMLSQLKTLIPGAQHWPSFIKNESEQFEARFVNVSIDHSPSVLLQGMQGSIIPVVVSHGEGRVQFQSDDLKAVKKQQLISLHYTHENYPYNPNGSVEGITGLTTEDGRVTIMMPHPERVFRAVQNSWHPSHWQEEGPWMRLFTNAQRFVI